jgi:hypothetical protein
MPDFWERLEIMERKTKGVGKFTDLLRKVVSVPKEIVEQRIADKKTARKLRCKK